MDAIKVLIYIIPAFLLTLGYVWCAWNRYGYRMAICVG